MHQSDSELPSATFRKIESPHTMGVAPLHSGSGSFQAMFDVAVHVSGRPVSVLTPFNCGPRHCGQLSAERVLVSSAATSSDSNVRLMASEYRKRDYSARSASSMLPALAARAASAEERRPLAAT